jgi:hypothetical protein
MPCFPETVFLPRTSLYLSLSPKNPFLPMYFRTASWAEILYLWCKKENVLRDLLCSWSGRPARPRTQHGYYHDTKVKPDAATAVIELLMMGGKTPETCWAVNKRQDNKLKNCCIWLVIYFNCTMIHGFTNLQ